MGFGIHLKNRDYIFFLEEKERIYFEGLFLKEKREISRNLSNQNQDLRKVLRDKDFNLRTKRENLTKNLQNLKETNNKNLTDLKNSFYRMKEQMKNSQNLILKKELEANMKGNINRLLKELTLEIYSQEMNCPTKLKPYLNYGDYSSITTMYKNLLKDTEKEEQYIP